MQLYPPFNHSSSRQAKQNSVPVCSLVYLLLPGEGAVYKMCCLIIVPVSYLRSEDFFDVGSVLTSHTVTVTVVHLPPPPVTQHTCPTLQYVMGAAFAMKDVFVAAIPPPPHPPSNDCTEIGVIVPWDLIKLRSYTVYRTEYFTIFRHGTITATENSKHMLTTIFSIPNTLDC